MNSDTYTYCKNEYNKNKNKDWKEWLKYKNTFGKPGKQGLVGLMSLKDKEDSPDIVFKLSQYINHLVEHEYVIMSGLKKISEFCPHFCKSIGIINAEIEPTKRKTGNPFKITSKYPINKNILLCEYIEGVKFANYIRSDNVSDKIIYSIIKQVLLAIIIAQKKKKFTHYDLHSYNIIIKKCNKDAVFLYVLDEENQFCVPTYGYYPVIIDFGFSYIEDMENKPLWLSLAHTAVGFTSDRFDWLADPKLFLITIANELKINRKDKKMAQVVENIFYPLDVEWDSGWDCFEKLDAIDYAQEYIADYVENDDVAIADSKLFKDLGHYCMDLIQSLIILPLEKQDYKKVGKAYMTFVSEWHKIEKEFINSFYTLYILKNIIDSARQIRPEYNDKNTMKYAVKKFRNAVHESIEKVSKFCSPKNINYELMLCSLLVVSKGIEGLLYEYMEKQMKKKNKYYKKLPIHSVEEIYAVIDVNFKDDYVYNKKTSICVFDSHNEKSSVFTPTKEMIKEVNNLHPLSRGTFLYDSFK